MAIVLEADQQGDGPTTSQTGAAVHSRKLFTWRATGTSGGQSLASTAHMGHEFTERERETVDQLQAILHIKSDRY